MKANFEQQTRDIVEETRNELNERNVDGYLHKAGYIHDEIKAANEYFLSKFENLSGKSNSKYNREMVIANYYFVLIMLLTSRMNYRLMSVAVVVVLTPLFLKRKW